MTFSFAVFTFIVAWWTVLFAVLPFVIEHSDSKTPLEYAAAPKSIRWKKAFLMTTLLAALATALIALVMQSNLLPMRE